MRPLDPPKSALKGRKPLPGTAAPHAAGPDAFASRLDEAEKALERVRALHESHFLGLEKRAPEPERVDLQRRLNELRRLGTSNTALRFRLETLVQRHIVLSTYWTRTLREIEAGTYRRDVFKAKRHQAERTAGVASTAGHPPLPVDAPGPTPGVAPPAPALAERAATAPAPTPPAAPPHRAPPPPPAAPPRAVPPPIPAAALKRAAAAAIMSKPAPAVPAAAPSPATTPPPSSIKR